METGAFLKSFEKLKAYCESQEYKGWDPYDGLNSSFFQALPIRHSRFMRLAWIQTFKRNPINLRPLLGVRKGYNPKGLGLFLTGYCNLFKVTEDKCHLEKMNFFIQEILKLKSIGYSGSCWGYNFDWQARAFFQPKYTPTVVATAFIANGLLDAYEILKDEDLLLEARSSCDFILNDLNRTYNEDGNFAFSYSPEDQTQIFNASLLGSKLLSRVYSHTKEDLLLQEAKKSVLFCCKHQQANGAWSYGTLPYHSWIDNFHSGYNLECLHEYQIYTNDRSFNQNIEKGLSYYLNTFFTPKGESKFYNDSLYPIDIHAPAQLVVTLSRLGRLEEHMELVHSVLNWTITNMQNEKGYFYYQLKKIYSSKIPYIRWAQAWMFYSMTFYIKNQKETLKNG